MPAFGLPAAPTSPSSRLASASRSSPLAGETRGGLLPPPAFRGASVHQRLQAVAAGVPADDVGSSSLKQSAGALEEDVFGPVMMIPKDDRKTSATGSAEERQRALFERVCPSWSPRAMELMISIDKGPFEQGEPGAVSSNAERRTDGDAGRVALADAGRAQTT